MRITIGRGNNRKSTEIGTGPHVDKETREKNTWDLTRLLFNNGYLGKLK